MEYENIDFNTDKAKEYEAIRKAIAHICTCNFAFYASTCTCTPHSSFWLRDK